MEPHLKEIKSPLSSIVVRVWADVVQALGETRFGRDGRSPGLDERASFLILTGR